MRPGVSIGVAVLLLSHIQAVQQTGTATPPTIARLSAEDDAFLEDLSRRSFMFFWEQTDPATGIVRDRSRTDGSPSSENHARVGSIASVGFGLSGMCIAAERGWLPRDEVVERTRVTLRTFAEKLFHKNGWFYHWLNIHTGEREWKSEVSSIDTALLMGGVLSVKQCFKHDARIVRDADTIYRRLDFAWIRNGHPTLLSHGWRPETDMIVHRWDAYSEAMILYLLGLGSPTSPLPPESWRAWVRPWLEWRGFRYVMHVPPLFIHQYSHAWVDFRAWRDREPPHDWFGNAVTATHANRQFGIDLADRFPGYTPLIWGLTASDGRKGYRAWGGPPLHPDVDGTVVPAAAAGSLMLAPDITVPALREMKRQFGDRLYGRYGFADAFHPTEDWINPDVIGIDLGITLLSAENLRTGRVWQWFMANPEIQTAIERAGFTPASPGQKGDGPTAARDGQPSPFPIRPTSADRPRSSNEEDALPARTGHEYRLIPMPEDRTLTATRETVASFTPLAERFEAGTFTAPNGVTLQHRLFSPANRTSRLPLIVVLHGSGEIGTDNKKQLTSLSLSFAGDRVQQQTPAFILAPQFPSRASMYSGPVTASERVSEPGPPLEAALMLIKDTIARQPIDATRVYLVGFSMGASSTFNALHLAPDLFAAAIPIAGVPNPAHVATLARTPMWIVHGNRDDVNNGRHVKPLFTPLVDGGATVHYWEMDLLGHDVPVWLLANGSFARWLAGHQRKGSTR